GRRLRVHPQAANVAHQRQAVARNATAGSADLERALQVGIPRDQPRHRLGISQGERMTDLDELDRLEKAATGGPWETARGPSARSMKPDVTYEFCPELVIYG